MNEIQTKTMSGYLTMAIVLFVFILCVYGFIVGVREKSGLTIATSIIVLIADLVLLGGLFQVQPNQAAVLTLFGRYVGTVTETGLRFANPFFSKNIVSLRVRNFETNHLKVNDHDGNPVEIGAVVVWRVVNAAQATFDVDKYDNYVVTQSEAALRTLATAYPYDAHQPNEISLRASSDVVAERLQHEIQERLRVAGVEVVEARISHLAYAPEIAGAMLQRQQASAIVAARGKIVEGAVGMVESALEMLSARQVIHLDEERKAAMVSNLLVVLCGERGATPVINSGTLHN